MNAVYSRTLFYWGLYVSCTNLMGATLTSARFKVGTKGRQKNIAHSYRNHPFLPFKMGDREAANLQKF